MDVRDRRIAILIDGFRDLCHAKTAWALLRYRPSNVAALIDRQSAGRTAQDVLGAGSEIPVVARLDQAVEQYDANSLLIGTASAGGRLPERWRDIVIDAACRGLDIYAGLHTLLRDDPEIHAAAEKNDAQLFDLRHQPFDRVARGKPFPESCTRVMTIGTDCSCGKMVTAWETTECLKRRHIDARFVATGQTGILLAGTGIAVDHVRCDFLSGAAEQLVLDNSRHRVLLIEGQAGLFHPRYSAVTLGMIHGARPDAMILCHPLGRRLLRGMPDRPVPDPETIIPLYETMARLVNPAARVIAVAVSPGDSADGCLDPASVDLAQWRRPCQDLERRLGLPVCDVLLDGPDRLADTVCESLEA